MSGTRQLGLGGRYISTRLLKYAHLLFVANRDISDDVNESESLAVKQN